MGCIAIIPTVYNNSNERFNGSRSLVTSGGRSYILPWPDPLCEPNGLLPKFHLLAVMLSMLLNSSNGVDVTSGENCLGAGTRKR